MHFSSAVVLEHGKNAHRREHHGEAGALGGVLPEAQKHHHGRHEHEAASDTNETRSHTSGQANGKERQQRQRINGHGKMVQKSKFKDKVNRRGNVMPSSTP
jgi:hypothetical protein